MTIMIPRRDETHLDVIFSTLTPVFVKRVWIASMAFTLRGCFCTSSDSNNRSISLSSSLTHIYH